MAIALLAIAAVSLVSGLMSSKIVKEQGEAQAEADSLSVIRDLDANRREASALLGSQKAGFAFSGVDVSVGSPAMIELETLTNAWRDQKTISDIGNAQIRANLAASGSGSQLSFLQGVGGGAKAIGGLSG